jgi:hypothetical protein
MEWVQAHHNDPGNARADELVGQASELPPPPLANAVSIAWMRQTVSEQYTAAANIELREKGPHTITLPPLKKSALDKGPNSESRAVAQPRSTHWLSGVYLKRIKKRSHDGCWLSELVHNSQDSPRMTWTHVLLRCVAFEEFRLETWTDPLAGEFTRPSSNGQLFGNPRWEKHLLKFLPHTNIRKKSWLRWVHTYVPNTTNAKNSTFGLCIQSSSSIWLTYSKFYPFWEPHPTSLTLHPYECSNNIVYQYVRNFNTTPTLLANSNSTLIPIHISDDMNHLIHITIAQLPTDRIPICCPLVNSLFRIQFGSVF